VEAVILEGLKTNEASCASLASFRACFSAFLANLSLQRLSTLSLYSLFLQRDSAFLLAIASILASSSKSLVIV
jgi:hypothetical protein